MAKKKNGNFIARVLKNIGVMTLAIMLIDFVSYSIVFLIASAFQQTVMAKVADIGLAENIMMLSEQQVFELSTELEGSYFYFIFLVIAAILSIIFFWTISRAVLWKLSRKERTGLKYILKSLPLGFVWYGLAALPVVAIFATLREDISMYVFMVYMIILTYYSIILFINYSADSKFQFLKTLKEGSTRLDLLISFIVFVLIYYLITQGLNIIYRFAIGWLISALILMFYLAVSRYYFIELKKRG